jgi:hypothetical protein
MLPTRNPSLEAMLKLGTLTGSRAFNCATDESDWDIVITESMLPNLSHPSVGIYSDTNFMDDPFSELQYSKYKSGHSVDTDELPDLGEDFVEYDQHTIWGPLLRTIKYECDGAIINLFVYKDTDKLILDKFTELNNLMRFVHGLKLHDREYRIQAFIELTFKLGITDY